MSMSCRGSVVVLHGGQGPAVQCQVGEFLLENRTASWWSCIRHLCCRYEPADTGETRIKAGHLRPSPYDRGGSDQSAPDLPQRGSWRLSFKGRQNCPVRSTIGC